MTKDKNVKCSCTITVAMNDDILTCGKHSDKCLELTDMKVDVYRSKERVKERVRSETMASASSKYKEECEALIVKSQQQISELAKYMKQFRNMQSTLTRKKSK